MKRYKNITYQNRSEYEKVKEKFKESFVIEINFNKFITFLDFDKFLSTKINAPSHYFGGLDRLSDLLLDFHCFDNPEEITLLIKNYEYLKKINRLYYKHFLALLDTAVDYLNKSEEAILRAYVFLNDDQLREINKRKFEKTFVSYIGSKMKNKKRLRELVLKNEFKKAKILSLDVEVNDLGQVLVSMAAEKQVTEPLKFVEYLIKTENNNKKKAEYMQLASNIQFDSLSNFQNSSRKGLSYLKKAVKLDPENEFYKKNLKSRKKMIHEFGE